MDFLANLVKRPISVAANEDTIDQASHKETPSDAKSSSSHDMGIHTPSPLIAAAMNTSINTEMTDLLESAREDLLRIEGSKSRSPSKDKQEVLQEGGISTTTTTILIDDNTSKTLQELMDQINQNLNQVSDDEDDGKHREDVAHDIDQLNLHETQTHLDCYQELSPMTSKPKLQQLPPQSTGMSAPIQGAEDKGVDAFGGVNIKNMDINAGGDALTLNNATTSSKKLTGLTEFDETQIPDLALGSTTVSDAQLKEDLLTSYTGNTTIPQLSSTIILPNKEKIGDNENEYNSDSELFAECHSVHNEKSVAELTSGAEAYCSALNFDATLEDNASISANAAILEQNKPSSEHFEPMDISLNSTLESQNALSNEASVEPIVLPVGLISANQIIQLAQNISGAGINILPNSFSEESSSEAVVDTFVASGDETKIENNQQSNEEKSRTRTQTDAGTVEIFSVKELRNLAMTDKTSPPTLDMTGSFGSIKATSTRLPSPNLLPNLEGVADAGVNLTLDMTSLTSSFGSVKSGGSNTTKSPASPTFPLKQNKSSSTFPISPHAPPEKKEMTFLECLDPLPLKSEQQKDLPKSVDIEFITIGPQKTKQMPMEEVDPALNGTFDSGMLARTDSEKRRTFCIAPTLDEEPLADSDNNNTNTFTFPTSKSGDLDSKPRRTFSIVDTEKVFTNENETAAPESESNKNPRRTFNLPPRPEPMECDEPMDVDQSLPLDNQKLEQDNVDLTSRRQTFNLSEQQIINSPPLASIKSNFNVPEYLPACPIDKSEQQIINSPPLVAIKSNFNVPKYLPASPIDKSEQQTINSPPLVAVKSNFNVPEYLPASPIDKSEQQTINSPPLVAVKSNFNVPEYLPASPPIASLRSTFNVPEHPPNMEVVSTSPPLPTLEKYFNKDPKDDVKANVGSQRKPHTHRVNLKRPSIHKTRVGEHKLSEKESNSKDEKDVFVETVASESSSDATLDDTFATPRSTSEFSKLKAAEKHNNTVDEEDQDQFFDVDENHADVIFNPSDIDYLMTRGNNNEPVDIDPRNSVLLKFDPLLGAPVQLNQTSTTLAKQQQDNRQELLQAFGFNSHHRSLSPTLEESEKSFSSLDHEQQQGQQEVEEQQSQELLEPTAAEAAQPLAPLAGLQRAKTGDTYILKSAVDRLTKHAKMSVEVIDNNDCNKTFENSNLQSEEKQLTYNKMDELEKKLKNEVLKSSEDFEKKLRDAEQREEALIKRITEKDKTITKMTGVIEAYEKAIAELINEKEQMITNYERQLTETKADRDSNYHHLTSLETTFSDLHVKYEKSKEMTQQLKATEEVLLNEKKQLWENLRLQEQRYEKMKGHAMQQLEIANKKLETVMKENAIETTKLRASLKKEEISRCSVQEQLQQKTIENAELVKICDELINGQGS